MFVLNVQTSKCYSLLGIYHFSLIRKKQNSTQNARIVQLPMTVDNLELIERTHSFAPGLIVPM